MTVESMAYQGTSSLISMWTGSQALNLLQHACRSWEQQPRQPQKHAPSSSALKLSLTEHLHIT